MKIKNLEWKEIVPEFFEAKIQGTRFEIFKLGTQGYGVKPSLRSEIQSEIFPTLQEAKDAAQSALEEYVRGFCDPDPLDSQIESLIRENFELKGLLEKAEEKIRELKAFARI